MHLELVRIVRRQIHVLAPEMGAALRDSKESDRLYRLSARQRPWLLLAVLNCTPPPRQLEAVEAFKADEVEQEQLRCHTILAAFFAEALLLFVNF